jgi:hypothetical protein
MTTATTDNDSPLCFSDEYHVAMAKIMSELAERDPMYSNPHDPEWETMEDPPSVAERRKYIINCISITVMRASAILAHNILGTEDPDRDPQSFSDLFDPMDLLLGALLYRTPSYYINSQMKFMFRSGSNSFGYTLELETVQMMHLFTEIADILSSTTDSADDDEMGMIAICTR